MKARQHSSQSGFTVIETLITVIVAVILLLAINILFIAVIRSTASSRNRAEASALAYANLRKYAYPGAATAFFTCSSQTDLQQNADAKGQTLDEGTLAIGATTLPQPVLYSVRAYAPYGCTTTLATSPLMIRSVVTYGSDKTVVDHATYVERAL